MSGAAIREAILTRIVASSLFKTVARSPAGTLQPSQLPYCGVFVLRDSAGPDGDANAGAPRFIHDITIGMSLVTAKSDTDALREDVEGYRDTLLAVLLQDPTFVRFGQDALFEAVMGMEWRVDYPGEGETYFAEGQMELMFRHRSEWAPLIPDTFEELHITTRIAENVQHVRLIDINPDP